MKLEMTPRDILLIRVSVTALMLVLAIRFLIVPQAEKMREAGEELVRTEAAAESMQRRIEGIPELEERIEQRTAELRELQVPYYKTLENHELDELVTGIVLRHQLFPLSLAIGEGESRIPDPYLYSEGGVQDAETAIEKDAEEALDNGQNGQENPAEAAAAEAEAMAEAAAAGTEAAETETAVEEPEGYVRQVEVAVSLRGEEADVMSFLDDIWNNYPSIQIKTAQMEEETYADADLKAVGQTNLKCVLVVYMCSELEQK